MINCKNAGKIAVEGMFHCVVFRKTIRTYSFLF